MRKIPHRVYNSTYFDSSENSQEVLRDCSLIEDEIKRLGKSCQTLINPTYLPDRIARVNWVASCQTQEMMDTQAFRQKQSATTELTLFPQRQYLLFSQCAKKDSSYQKNAELAKQFLIDAKMPIPSLCAHQCAGKKNCAENKKTASDLSLGPI